MGLDNKTLAAAKSYVKKSIQGQGALVGQKGDPGKDGVDGKDAPTITNVSIDENNVLSTTLSDGTTLPGGTIKTIQGKDGKDGISIPKGGQTGQVLVKKSETDYDAEWIDFSNSSSEGNIEDYTTIQGILNIENNEGNFAFVQGTL